MTPPRAIVWDWDNTLVDGWPAIQAGLNAAFREFGLPEWSLEEVRARVRHSLRDSFPVLFGQGWERARDIFYAGVRAMHLAVLRPMPGASDLLAAAAAVAPLAVLSNKQGALLRAEAAHLRWTAQFTALIGAGDAAGDKPDPRPMRLACAACGVPAGEGVWYVGDTRLDMQAARAAGCVPVLLGDAAHDGGAEAAAPRLHFSTSHEMASALSALAMRAEIG
ncbi:HAD family hydrolase [Muricoccus radiodurans]|uniref:HAD family hydrolase n=1 Tax=Muricoccus radiodurans TaxID=2231721 RepID=UPI003CF5D906